MYILVLILTTLVSVGGPVIIEPITKPDEPMILQDCVKLRDSVRKNMQEAYPGDTNYTIECVRLKGSEV